MMNRVCAPALTIMLLSGLAGWREVLAGDVAQAETRALGTRVALRQTRRPTARHAGSPDGEGAARFTGDSAAQVGKSWEGDILFTVGPRGIAKGGGIRIFTPPICWAGPPETEGAVRLETKGSAKAQATALSRQVLGWVIVIAFPDAPLAPGDRIGFHYSAPEIQKYSQEALVWLVESDVDGDGAFALLDEKSLPVVRVVAGRPARLRLAAPSILAPGREFQARLLVMDDLNNPVEQDLREPITVALAGAKAQAPVRGNHGQVTLSAPRKEGYCHLTASANGLETCYLPVKVSSARSLKLYWGMLHGHTENSDGLGSIDEYYTYGRDIGFLDFCAANDHAERLRDRGVWQAYVAAAQRYCRAGRYVTLLGYEWTTEGHRNVYFATADPDLPLLAQDMPETDTYEKFVAALKRSGKPVIVGKHTAHPLDTRKHDPALERLVEIQSMWGTTEYPGCPGWTKGADKYVPAASGQTLLGSGYRVGFVGGGDSHAGRPGRNWYGTRWGPLLRGREGLTAALAPTLTREAVFNALDQLRCYATSGPRILVDVRANGHLMGESFETAENPKLAIEAAGTTEIAQIDLLRDNFPIAVRSPKAMIWRGEMEDGNVPPGIHWYYVRVTQSDGERAWTTPIWVTKQ